MSIEEKIKLNAKHVWHYIKRKKNTIKAVKRARQCALAPSYYPEAKLKSEDKRIADNVAWAKKIWRAK